MSDMRTMALLGTETTDELTTEYAIAQTNVWDLQRMLAHLKKGQTR